MSATSKTCYLYYEFSRAVTISTILGCCNSYPSWRIFLSTCRVKPDPLTIISKRKRQLSKQCAILPAKLHQNACRPFARPCTGSNEAENNPGSDASPDRGKARSGMQYCNGILPKPSQMSVAEMGSSPSKSCLKGRFLSVRP